MVLVGTIRMINELWGGGKRLNSFNVSGRLVSRRRSLIGKLALSLLPFLLALGYLTGWFVPFVSAALLSAKAAPGLWALLAALAFPLAFYLARGVRAGNEVKLSYLIAYLVVVIGPLAWLVNVTAISQVGNSLKVVELKELPNLVGVYRLIPLPTAYKYAIDRIQLPTHTIYYQETYVYYNGTRPIYNWLIEPEGVLNSLFRDPRGAVFVYADAYPPEVKIVRQDLTWGLHNYKLTPLFLDSLALESLFSGAFGKEVVWEDVADVYLNGQVVQLLPVVDYKPVFPGSLPYIDSYLVVYPNGTILKVRPEEAVRYGVPALPERVARRWVDALRVKDWVQAVFFHNTFTIRDVGDNPQPYLLLDEEGRPWWVFVAEPPGNTYSAYMILLVNASSTEPTIYVYKFDKPKIGVSKAYSYVMKAHPNWAWDSLKVQEPLPTTINSTFYWKLSVTTSDSRGLVSVEFVDADSGNAVSVSVKGKLNAEEVLASLLKGRVSKKEEPNLNELLRKIEQIKAELNELEEMVKEIASK